MADWCKGGFPTNQNVADMTLYDSSRSLLTRTLPLWNSGIVLTDTRLNNWGGSSVIAIFAQWLTNKAWPNKSDPHCKASKLGCLPLSAPLASVRESSLRRGNAAQLATPETPLSGRRELRSVSDAGVPLPFTRNAMPVGARAILWLHTEQVTAC